MTAAPAAAQTSLKPPFLNYQFGRGYDEMFECQGVPREHYQALYRTLLESPPEELRKSQQAADLSFLERRNVSTSITTTWLVRFVIFGLFR